MKFGQVIKTLETYFLKNHLQNVVEKLFPDLFLKKIKIEYIFGSMVLKFYTVCIYCMLILKYWNGMLGLLNYSETKLQTTSFCLM